MGNGVPEGLDLRVHVLAIDRGMDEAPRHHQDGGDRLDSAGRTERVADIRFLGLMPGATGRGLGRYLLAWADNLKELKAICFCGSKATMVIRMDEDGNAVTEGTQVEIGGNDRYVSMCRKHFKENYYRKRVTRGIESVG